MATRPCNAPISPFSSRIFTAKTVLEKLSAKAIKNDFGRSSSLKNGTPARLRQKTATPSTVTVNKACIDAPPHISGRIKLLISSFKPMEKRRSVTPRSAKTCKVSPPAKPNQLRTNPAARYPTSGGSPTCLTRKPRRKATTIINGSMG